jgi:uncharacterized membrane protein YgdD (TMEM256/DUF423 family)
MKSKTTFWAAIIAGLAVAFGAFGAHFLEQRLEPEQMETFQTGVQYQMYHALALFTVGIYKRLKPNKRLDHAAFAFILGIFLFSGSLYLITISKFTRFNLDWMGAITPLGGISFLVGWSQVAWATLGAKKT